MQDEIVQRPSPNFGPRRDGLKPHLIVLHHTAMQSGDAAIERLCDPAAEVSAHYLIRNTGQIIQMVPEDMRAWHAGAGEWLGHDDINSRSIGIELDNRGTHPFSHPQMTALERLLPEIMTRWNIPAQGVIGHSDMAPGRKTDPGPHFDWARLAYQGLAAHLATDLPQVTDHDSFLRAARASGYTADVPLDTLLSAVRLRHAPWRKGPLQAQDQMLAR